MPQSPIAATIAKTPGNVPALAKLNANGSLIVVSEAGGDAVTIADGADVAQGAKADAAWAAGNGTIIGLLKAIAVAANKLIFGTAGSLLVAFGINSTLNVTAAAVIKAAPGRLVRIIVLVPGATAGAFTLNDCLTTGAATTANQIFTLPYNAAANVAGAIFAVDMPVSVGLVVSAVPTTGAPQLALVWN